MPTGPKRFENTRPGWAWRASREVTAQVLSKQSSCDIIGSWQLISLCIGSRCSVARFFVVGGARASGSK